MHGVCLMYQHFTNRRTYYELPSNEWLSAVESEGLREKTQPLTDLNGQLFKLLNGAASTAITTYCKIRYVTDHEYRIGKEIATA